MESNLTPSNLPNYQLGLIQGNAVTKGKKEVTMQDYVNYTKTSGVGRIFSKLSLFFEKKGWVDEKSLKALAERKIGSLNNEQLEEINDVAGQILGANVNQVAKDLKERNQYEKQIDIANEAQLLVLSTYRQKDDQVRFGLQSLSLSSIQKDDKDIVQLEFKDEGINQLFFNEYKPFIVGLSSIKKDNIAEYKTLLEINSSTEVIEPARKHMNYVAIREAANSISNSNWAKNDDDRNNVVAGFVEYLVEQITEDKISPDKKALLESYVAEHGTLEQLIALKNAGRTVEDLEDTSIEEDGSSKFEDDEKFASIKEEVTILNKEKDFSSMSLSEIAKAPEYKESFPAFADEIGKKLLVDYDVGYFEKYEKTLGKPMVQKPEDRPIEQKSNIQKIEHLQAYFIEKREGREIKYTLDVNGLTKSNADLLKNLFSEYRTLNKTK